LGVKSDNKFVNIYANNLPAADSRHPRLFFGVTCNGLDYSAIFNMPEPLRNGTLTV